MIYYDGWRYTVTLKVEHVGLELNGSPWLEIALNTFLSFSDQ